MWKAQFLLSDDPRPSVNIRDSGKKISEICIAQLPIPASFLPRGLIPEFPRAKRYRDFQIIADGTAR